MNTNFDEIRDSRSQAEIVLAARKMRAEYLRELFARLRATLSGDRAGHGPAALSPSAR
ncbi:RSP_7527 family protein [Azospirillum humicireducens]|uniref:RSP_7527 family protein n=1 Tax=Azospirillum humicireducens TaxID=1226968 RepID=UPI000A47A48C|nr:hypothetical protein [Azospirillum humicireducens]